MKIHFKMENRVSFIRDLIQALQKVNENSTLEIVEENGDVVITFENLNVDEQE